MVEPPRRAGVRLDGRSDVETEGRAGQELRFGTRRFMRYTDAGARLRMRCPSPVFSRSARVCSSVSLSQLPAGDGAVSQGV